MNCGCGGKCGCDGLGDYRPALPLAFAGWNLRIPGNPPGGQYHGYLGAMPNDFANPGSHSGKIYRAPGETPPQMTAGGPTVRVRHSPRQAGFSISPGAYKQLGAVAVPVFPPFRACPAWGCDGPPITFLPFRPSGGSTSAVPQPPPPFAPITPPSWNWRRGPVSNGACPGGQTQDAAGNCVQNQQYGVVAACQPGQTVDASGECVTDLRNPYSLYLPTAQPSPVIASPTVATPTAGQATCASGTYDASGNCVAVTPALGTSTGLSWFTDPTQELISGFPNWGLVAAAVAAFLMMKGRR